MLRDLLLTVIYNKPVRLDRVFRFYRKNKNKKLLCE